MAKILPKATVKEKKTMKIEQLRKKEQQKIVSLMSVKKGKKKEINNLYEPYLKTSSFSFVFIRMTKNYDRTKKQKSQSSLP